MNEKNEAQMTCPMTANNRGARNYFSDLQVAKILNADIRDIITKGFHPWL